MIIFAINCYQPIFTIPRQFGKSEQPQNLLPAFGPCFAILSTIFRPHFGHKGTSWDSDFSLSKGSLSGTEWTGTFRSPWGRYLPLSIAFFVLYIKNNIPPVIKKIIVFRGSSITNLLGDIEKIIKRIRNIAKPDQTQSIPQRIFLRQFNGAKTINGQNPNINENKPSTPLMLIPLIYPPNGLFWYLRIMAQRLVAQALGHIRVPVTILAGNLKSLSSVLSLSLGQVACSHVLGRLIINTIYFKI
jgi:hypothetical protein